MKIVIKMRDMAANLKKNKTDLASSILDGVQATHTINQKVLIVADGFIDFYKAMSIVQEKVLFSPVFRGMASTIIANTVQDLASRLNEVANLVEAVTKDETVAQAFDDLKASAAALEKEGADLQAWGKKQARSEPPKADESVRKEAQAMRESIVDELMNKREPKVHRVHQPASKKPRW